MFEDPGETMLIVCDGCGLKARVEALFRKYYPTVRGAPEHYCGVCWERRERGMRVKAWSVGAALVVVLLVVAAFSVAWEGRELVRLGGLLVITTLASVVLHEVGHAVLAWLTGMGVVEVCLGSGPLLWSIRRGGTEWAVRSLPTCGFVRPGVEGIRGGRLAHVLTSLGGPAVNLALMSIGLTLGTLTVLEPPVPMDGVTFWDVVVIVNGLIAAMSLIPLSYSSEDGGGVTDGMSMLRFLVSRRRTLDTWIGGWVRAHVEEFVGRGEEERALRIAERWNERYPGVLMLRLALAEALMRCGAKACRGARERAITLLRELLSDGEGASPERVLVQATLARCLVCGTADDLDEANTLSEEALAIAPDVAEVLAARAAVLVKRGWFAQGVTLLQKVLAGRESAFQRSRCAVRIAELEWEQGERRQARKYLDHAVALDSDHPELRAFEHRIAAEVGGA